MSQEYGAEFQALLDSASGGGATSTSTSTRVSPERFDELRRQAAETVSQRAGSTAIADQELCQKLVDVERRFLERVDELRQVVLDEQLGDETSGGLTECSLTPEQLSRYLRDKLPASPDVVVIAMSVVPGGRSKETILVSLTGTSELPPEVILRRDRPVGILQTRAIDEFGVLEAVSAHGGVPVPRPYFADELDEAMGGGTLVVMERVAGAKAGEYFPDIAAPIEHRRTLGEQFAVALAHLHQLPLEDADRNGP